MELDIILNTEETNEFGENSGGVVNIINNGKLIKFPAKDEYPRFFGINDECEVWNGEIEHMIKRNFQVTNKYFQTYICLCETEIQVWLNTVPSLLTLTDCDLVIPYKQIENNKIKMKI